MGALLTDKLQQAQRSRRIVAVQTDGPMFLGYILSQNPELLVMRTITRQGLLTGVRTISLGTVSQVHFDDRYVQLIEFKEHNPEVVYARSSAPEGMDNAYLTIPVLLRQAQNTRQLVLLEVQGEREFYGYVLRLTDDELLLEVYTQYGEADGQSVLGIDDVRSVVWSNEDTRTIELLLRQRGALDGRQKAE